MVDGRQGGYSLLEALISAAILLTMILVVTALSRSGSEAERYASRLTRATEVCQDMLDGIRRNLASSVHVFASDASGNAYVTMLELSPTAPRISDRLPALRPMGIFEREAVSQQISGNCLAFARHVWTDDYVCGSGNTYGVDVYRIHYYYLREDGNGLQPGSAIGLNFCRFVSEPLADGSQIDLIPAGVDRADVLRLLATGYTVDNVMVQPEPVHAPVAVVWRLGGDPAIAGTLRQIDSMGWSLSVTPLAPRASPWTIQRDSNRSSDGMLFFRNHSVATNESPTSYGVGRFSQMLVTGQGFPHGFETQLIGPAAARQVLLRLTVVSTNRAGHSAYARSEIIQDCRDI